MITMRARPKQTDGQTDERTSHRALKMKGFTFLLVPPGQVLCVCGWMLTRVEQIVTAADRDL